MEGDHEARCTGRRNLLRGAALTAASMGAPSLAGCATAASAQRSGVIQAPVGGSDEPYPIPWLDKNGSHNQAGAGLEPSSIYHFKGRIARAAEFIGSGVDGAGNRLAFGSRTTDNSFMQGECWKARCQLEARVEVPSIGFTWKSDAIETSRADFALIGEEANGKHYLQQQ